MLCPITMLPCGDSSHYSCYSHTQYTCTDTMLCPIGLLACGVPSAFACYNSADYTCNDGKLSPSVKSATSECPGATNTPLPLCGKIPYDPQSLTCTADAMRKDGCIPLFLFCFFVFPACLSISLSRNPFHEPPKFILQYTLFACF